MSLTGLAFTALRSYTARPFRHSMPGFRPDPPSRQPDKAPVAQLDRVPGYEPGGRRFESFRARQHYQRVS